MDYVADRLQEMRRLLVVSRINEVASVIVVRIQKLEARLLVHTSHAEILPLVADAHRAQSQRRYMHTSGGRQDAITTEASLRRWLWGPEARHCAVVSTTMRTQRGKEEFAESTVR